MTDGQSFYFVLSLFYLIECIKFAPLGSEALVSRTGKFGTCSLRQPFTTAWGLKKSVFLAPLLPWPASMYFLTGDNDVTCRSSRILLVSSIRHHQAFLQKATQPLRALAILNLLNFFVFLPIVYVRTYDERTILWTLAYCYATLLAAALHYRRLHKRLLPREGADRLKTTLYTSLLPWHAPRAVDEILLKSSLRWSPIATLAANVQNKAILRRLQYHWRAVHYHPAPRFNKSAIADALAQADISPADWLEPPTQLDSPQYCPCCHSGYETQATHCSDCDGVALRKELPSP
ncbi:hypothetical protein [Pelagicoccus sp. SDUM812002]|uniref:hypothetical protein n=1 Tax=Pelagicoccus sp. SDUM812002 TaxID=3041266 RepID=UPI0028109A47|nr:hypothetical protein [Pelagicoccus sp. SDUM812002]MDQ8187144.1 hypothetical protein [Pelagicoccus sp. SDUM812002]